MILDKVYTKSQPRGTESWSQQFNMLQPGTKTVLLFPFNFLHYNNFISNLFKKNQTTTNISATWVHHLAQGYFGM